MHQRFVERNEDILISSIREDGKGGETFGFDDL